MRYVVVREKRGTNHPVMHAQVVDARDEKEAVEQALEGETYETEDGGYDVWVIDIASMRGGVATRSTDVTIKATLDLGDG